ncbi:hypothetical protein [Brachybacterium hainanense]|uniref:Uncharacterized protein n=1 Tax=Brachybacterium hainanense TaxID=1541174 RepID=A0ABV6R852_9MICO
MLIGEHEEHPVLLVAQTRQQALPPGVGEILGLVHDDRVEQLVIHLLGGDLGEAAGEVLLVVLRLRAVELVLRLRTPAHRQVMEQTDEGGSLLFRPGGRQQLEMPGEAPRVAQQRGAEAVPDEGPGLDHRQVRLAGAGAAGDLRPMLEPQQGDRPLLLAGEGVGLVLDPPREQLVVLDRPMGAPQHRHRMVALERIQRLVRLARLVAQCADDALGQVG